MPYIKTEVKKDQSVAVKVLDVYLKEVEDLNKWGKNPGCVYKARQDMSRIITLRNLLIQWHQISKLDIEKSSSYVQKRKPRIEALLKESTEILEKWLPLYFPDIHESISSDQPKSYEVWKCGINWRKTDLYREVVCIGEDEPFKLTQDYEPELDPASLIGKDYITIW